MTIVANVYDAFSSMGRAEKLVPWAERNPEMASITQNIIKLRREVANRGN
jgi:hypothetical protein